LQTAYNLYGNDTFIFEILEQTNILDKQEQYWCDHFNSLELLYNTREIAKSTKGYKHTDKAKKLIGTAALGNKYAVGNTNRRKRVLQINPNTDNIVKIWDSQTHAAKALGIIRQAISRACNGKTKLCCGYRWENLNE
jgi:hypothetical protein